MGNPNLFTKDMARYDYEQDPYEELLELINSKYKYAIIYDSGDIVYIRNVTLKNANMKRGYIEKEKV